MKTIREERFKGRCEFCNKEIILLISADDEFLTPAKDRIILGMCCKLTSVTSPAMGISVPDLTRVSSKTWYK